MMMDKQNLFSDQQNLAVAAGNVLSDFSIDCGVSGWLDVVSGAVKNIPQGGTPPTDPGKGEHPELLIRVTQPFAGGTSIQVQLVQADDAALGTNMEVLSESPAVPDATAVLGFRFRLNEIPSGITRRFLGLRYVLVGGPHTTGKITAGILMDSEQTYP